MSKTKKISAGLSSGRPPLAHKVRQTLPSKVTRNIIRNHHHLHKQLARAEKNGNAKQISALESQIKEQGGLEAYQQASINGQSAERGGDSSKVLIQWMRECGLEAQSRNLKLLEIGALSTKNCCSCSGWFDMTWIDLHSQDPSIIQQDFMERPLPMSDAERFDGISLSLVLNYVPDSKGRGEMLKRLRQFLLPSKNSPCPFLFLVLPAPCVMNSRYLTEERLHEMMVTIGFRSIRKKVSPRLHYSLWQLEHWTEAVAKSFKKIEVNSGKLRNNFSIVIT